MGMAKIYKRQAGHDGGKEEEEEDWREGRDREECGDEGRREKEGGLE